MITKIQKWGNSQGLRLSKELLSDANMNIGDRVEISFHEGSLIITPVQRIHGRHDLKQLIKEIQKDYEVSELDWGAPSGKEVW